MVLNHIKLGERDNLNGCHALKSDLGSMKVVECTIADCDNADDANRVLDGVLQYLDRKIIEIEEQSARSCQNRLLEIFNFLNGELQKAQNALLAYVGESRRFESRFEETMEAMDIWVQLNTPHQSRLLLDFQLISVGRYEYAVKLINAIGQDLGGWIKQQKSRES
jgi:hypothetical protein